MKGAPKHQTRRVHERSLHRQLSTTTESLRSRHGDEEAGWSGGYLEFETDLAEKVARQQCWDWTEFYLRPGEDDRERDEDKNDLVEAMAQQWRWDVKELCSGLSSGPTAERTATQARPGRAMPGRTRMRRSQSQRAPWATELVNSTEKTALKA